MTPVQAAHEMKIPGDVLPKIYRYSNKETRNSILQALNKDLYFDQFKSLRDSKIIERIQNMDPKWLESTRVKLGVQRVLDVIKHGLGILQRDNVQLTDEQKECAFAAATNNLGDHEIMTCIQPNKPPSILYSNACMDSAMLAAAKNGNLASVKHWQPYCNEGTISDAILMAAIQGHKDVILFLRSFNNFVGLRLFEGLFIYAAGYGWEEIVQDMENKATDLAIRGFPYFAGDVVCRGAFEAAKNGHIKIANNLLRLRFVELRFNAYFRVAINQKLFPVIEVFAKYSRYISLEERNLAVIYAAQHKKEGLLRLLLVPSNFNDIQYDEISEVARGAAIIVLCEQKQHDLLRLLLKSGPIGIEDRQVAISIADQQNDQDSIAILNGK